MENFKKSRTDLPTKVSKLYMQRTYKDGINLFVYIVTYKCEHKTFPSYRDVIILIRTKGDPS